MFEYLRSDLQRLCHSDQASLWQCLWRIVTAPGLHATAVYRLGRWLKKAQTEPITLILAMLLWPMYLVLSLLVRKCYGIHLSLSAEIGPGLSIGHVGGIVVRNCRLGGHCTVNQQVWIMPAVGEQRGPVIADRVWIGAHARIVGNHCIGEGATIGGAAEVRGNVEPGCLMLGSPARVVQQRFDNSTILN